MILIVVVRVVVMDEYEWEVVDLSISRVFGHVSCDVRSLTVEYHGKSI